MDGYMTALFLKHYREGTTPQMYILPPPTLLYRDWSRLVEDYKLSAPDGSSMLAGVEVRDWSGGSAHSISINLVGGGDMLTYSCRIRCKVTQELRGRILLQCMPFLL